MNAFEATSAQARKAMVPQPLPAGGADRSRIEALKATRSKPGEASFFYRDHHFKQDAVKVLPGEYYVTQDDMVIMTADMRDFWNELEHFYSDSDWRRHR